jgi:hypothetical protein
MHVAPDLIEQIAQQLQQIAIDPARARELAIEVSRLNSAVLGAIDNINFDDEPAAFRALLERHSR